MIGKETYPYPLAASLETPLLVDDRLSADSAPLVPPNDQSPRVLVVGGGVTGLTTAWLLLDRGYHTTIISREWASYGDGPRLTSQVAGAIWELPPAGCGPQAPPYKLSMVQDWSLESLRVYRAIASNEELAKAYGVQMKMFTSYHMNAIETDQIKADKMELIKKLNLEGYSRGDHLFEKYGANVESHGGLKDAYEHMAPIIDTDVAMSFLMRLVRSKGAKLETDTIHGDILGQEDHLLNIYNADAIVNATGAWAGETAADETVYPLRGGMLRLINDGSDFPKVDNRTIVSSETKDAKGHFVDTAVLIPRNDDILALGSILHQDSWFLDLTTTCDEVVAMRTRCENLLPFLKNARLDPKYPLSQGRRPMRYAHVRVEREQRTKQDRPSRIVHSYGHSGAGWSLAFGSAMEVGRLVEELFDNGKARV